MTSEHFIAPMVPQAVPAPVLKKNHKAFFFILSVVSLYILYNLAFLFFHFTQGAALPLSHAVLIPAAVVEGEFVSYYSVAEMTNGILAQSPDKNHGKAFQSALSRSIDNAAVRSLAKKLDVDIGGIESAASSDDVFERKYIEEPLLLAQATEEAVYADAEYQTDAQNILLDLRARIVGGMPFADAAKKFSEDVTGGSGGDLGVFTLDALPVWLAPVARIDYNDISDVLNGPDAYWLATVYEHGGTELEPWVRIRGLAIKKMNLSEVISLNLRANPPWVFVW